MFVLWVLLLAVGCGFGFGVMLVLWFCCLGFGLRVWVCVVLVFSLFIVYCGTSLYIGLVGELWLVISVVFGFSVLRLWC